MEKLSKISKKVDTILKVVYWMLIVASAFVVVVFGLFAFIPGMAESPMHGNWILNIGNLELTLSKEMSQGIPFIRTETIVNMFTVAVIATFFCYGIKVLRKIMEPMKQEQPFVGTVSDNLKKLGWVIIIGSVVIGITSSIGCAMIYAEYNIYEMLLSDKVVEVSADFSAVDLKSVLLGALVLLLSHVFRYGEELQQQADETL